MKNFVIAFILILQGSFSYALVHIGTPLLSGNGCTTTDTMLGVREEDNVIFIIFKNYSASILAGGGLNYALSNSRKDCNFKLPIQLDTGYQIAMTEFYTDGFSNVAPADKGVYSYDPSLDGQRILSPQAMGQSLGTNGDFVVDYAPNVLVWSSCSKGQTLNLVARTSLSMRSFSGGTSSALLKYIVFAYQTRKCQ